jgi:hypothetical protein
MPEAPGAAALATRAGGPSRCRGGGRLGRARPDGRRSIGRAALPVSVTPGAGRRLAFDLIVAMVTV